MPNATLYAYKKNIEMKQRPNVCSNISNFQADIATIPKIF